MKRQIRVKSVTADRVYENVSIYDLGKYRDTQYYWTTKWHAYDTYGDKMVQHSDYYPVCDTIAIDFLKSLIVGLEPIIGELAATTDDRLFELMPQPCDIEKYERAKKIRFNPDKRQWYEFHSLKTSYAPSKAKLRDWEEVGEYREYGTIREIFFLCNQYKGHYSFSSMWDHHNHWAAFLDTVEKVDGFQGLASAFAFDPQHVLYNNHHLESLCHWLTEMDKAVMNMRSVHNSFSFHAEDILAKVEKEKVG